MKIHLFIVLLGGALMTLPTYGQESKHEIRAGVGIGDDAHIGNIQNQYIRNFNLEEGSNIPNDNSGYETSAFLEYYYHPNKHWAFGVSLGFSTASGEGASVKWDDRFRLDDSFQNHIDYIWNGIVYELWADSDIELHSKSEFLMPEVKYSWIAKAHFRLYSKLGFGTQHYKLDVTSDRNSFPERHENGLRLAYQASPLGIEAGGECMRGFVELGYGKQGVLNLGILLNL